MTEKKETPFMKRWREAQEANAEEEKEKARLMEESIKEDEEILDEIFKEPEETQPKPFSEYTEEEKAEFREQLMRESEEDAIRERKLKILETIEKQLEESAKQDEQGKQELQQIAELREKLKDWKAILDNPRWEEILSTYFKVVFAMIKGMAKKTVVTIIEKDGTMNFAYEFFDKDNKLIITEFNDGAKE